MGEKYTLNREGGLTEQERAMYARLEAGETPTAAGRALGVSKQRAHQLARSLREKGAWRTPAAQTEQPAAQQ